MADHLAAQPCSLALSGHVEDADSREKLAGATVLLKGSSLAVVTDANGDFRFPALCAGEYILQVSHADCGTLLRPVRLEKSLHLDLLLPHLRSTLREVTVESVLGTPNTGYKKELSGTRLDAAKQRGLAEALSRINGVTLLQTGSTIAKPVIQGLHSNRILTINNGVRQEGQQWGNEHAPEIDPFIADRLTVIKGVDELRYGSDAIGGVVLVQPRALSVREGSHGELNTAFFSNNAQYLLSGMFEQAPARWKGFRYRLQGTWKQGANTATPGYRLNNTASRELNFSATAAYRYRDLNTELYYSQFGTTLGIFRGSHIGNLTDLRAALEADRPAYVFTGAQTYAIGRPRQEVLHRLLKSSSTLQYRGHRFSLQLSAQYNHRSEFDVVRNPSVSTAQMRLSIITLAQDFSWEHPRSSHYSGTLGLAAMQQDNSYSGRYFIPAYRSYTYGGYYIGIWARHRWELQGGLRFDHKSIGTERLRYGGSLLNYDFRFSTFAGSVNAAYKAGRVIKLNLNAALASRAPHVNELLSDGIHHGTATYEQGSIFLKPEHSFRLSAGMQLNLEAAGLRGELTVYRNAISDFIYRQPVPDSPVLTIAGAFPKTEYRQTDATLTGCDASLQWQFHRHWELQTRASLLRARDRRLNDWLIWMPADRWGLELRWLLPERRRIRDAAISAGWQQVFRQSRVPDETVQGKQDYKAPPAGYQLLSLDCSAQFLFGSRAITLGLSVSNLLDTRYRDYLNSFRYFSDETGRNIGIRLKIPFSTKTATQ